MPEDWPGGRITQLRAGRALLQSQLPVLPAGHVTRRKSGCTEILSSALTISKAKACFSPCLQSTVDHIMFTIN